MGVVVAGTDLRLCAVAPIALWFQGLQGNRTSTLRISLRIHHNDQRPAAPAPLRRMTAVYIRAVQGADRSSCLLIRQALMVKP